jgi:hypothetical protein
VAEDLDEPAVARIARIGGHDVEERALLGATARQSDHDHLVSLILKRFRENPTF